MNNMIDMDNYPEGVWRMLSNNPQTGVSTWGMREGDDFVIQTRQDASALLDENTAIRNVTSPGWRGDYHSIARIPTVAMYDGSFHEAAKDGDEPWVKRFLNNSDNAKLRTKEGNL